MVTIDRLDLPVHLSPAELWAELPRRVLDWLAAHALPPRDTVLLLPFAELLSPARRAFAAAGGWQPRIETALTLADTLGPAPDPVAGGPSGDVAIDRLLAASLLAPLAGVGAWRRRDPSAFDQAVGDVVTAVHALRRGAAQQPPARRAAWWAQAREVQAGTLGPAAVARGLGGALARMALEWAALSPPAATDRLFALRPAAWIVLSAGGDDPLAGALLADAAAHGVPGLVLAADPPPAQLFGRRPPQPCVLVAADGEAEAQGAAAAVLQALAAGRSPVALVVEDRQLVRRVHALLARRGVSVADESGWTLSTTRAAAQLMALLKASAASSPADARLDALKADLPLHDSGWIDTLEAHWRRGQPPRADDERLAAALARWEAWRAPWQGFAAVRRQTLSAWLAALRQQLAASPSAERWSTDAAARAVWAALRLDSASAREDVDALPLTLDEFTRWVDATLAAGRYIAAVDREQAQVVFTPLARAMLRPFGALVLPGADERRLGPPPPSPLLLGDALLRAIGLPDREARAHRGMLAFVQLLRLAPLTLVRRRAEGDEPLGPSVWLTRLRLAQAAAARAGDERIAEQAVPGEQPVVLPLRTLAPVAVRPPIARAVGALPAQVSASAIDALRACPYRFHARSVLRLKEIEELAADPDKREYGTLLHEVLHRFHDRRPAGDLRDDALRAAEHARLLAVADEVAAEHRLDAPAMLPFRAGMPAFGQRYLDWLAQRDMEGWTYAGGEIDRLVSAKGLPQVQLHGRIDRVDAKGSARQLIDYKTGQAPKFRERLQQPGEDVQLAFYAALLLAGEAPPETLSACYLALDDRKGITPVAHPDVVDGARQLVDHLAGEWQRMAQGEALRALGEGESCTYCAARGLCRRDHWHADDSGAALPEPVALPVPDA